MSKSKVRVFAMSERKGVFAMSKRKVRVFMMSERKGVFAMSKRKVRVFETSKSKVRLFCDVQEQRSLCNIQK